MSYVEFDSLGGNAHSSIILTAIAMMDLLAGTTTYEEFVLQRAQSAISGIILVPAGIST